MKWLEGYRNVAIGLAYMGLCAWLGHSAGPESITEMGSTYLSLGAGVAGVVFGRGFNKIAERKSAA